MNRDFKGVWIPRELWESRISFKDLEAILNRLYLKHSLPDRIWKMLRERRWAKWNANEMRHQFTEEFLKLWEGNYSE